MNTLHPHTETLITRFRANSPQSLLISGPSGVGLLDIAHLIAAGSQTTIVSPDDSKASRPISTETIRLLYERTRSKSDSRQYVIIDEAHAMTHSAQGAFLKLLEEPNASIYFILTSSKPDDLLPTICSRVQHHTIVPVTLTQSEDYLSDLGVTDVKKRQQLLYLAGGLPEELTKLASDDTYFEQASQRMKDARQLLQAPQYEKLVTINSYRENRANATELIRFAMRMTRRSLSERPQTSLAQQLERLLVADETIQANGNVRLTLTRLVL